MMTSMLMMDEENTERPANASRKSPANNRVFYWLK